MYVSIRKSGPYHELGMIQKWMNTPHTYVMVMNLIQTILDMDDDELLIRYLRADGYLKRAYIKNIRYGYTGNLITVGMNYRRRWEVQYHNGFRYHDIGLRWGRGWIID